MMKQKLLNKDIKTPLIGFIVVWGITHTLTYFQYSGIDSNVGFLDVWLLLVTYGFLMLMMSLVIFTSDMFPIDFYKTDGEKFLFFHNNLSIFAKIFLVFSSASLLTLGFCLEPQSDLIDDRYFDVPGWLEWLVYIFGGIIVLGIIGSIIVSIKNLITDRNDSVYIDNELIKWFDNIEGETIINSQEIKKIEIEREISSRDDTPLGVQTIKILTQNESHIIDLDKMSLLPFGDKIVETIKITYPNITTE